MSLHNNLYRFADYNSGLGDHAAELQRHTPGWMSWSDYRLNISWLGFTDLHCKVDKYFVSVGSQYITSKHSVSHYTFYHIKTGG
jgi:hypothetical protein